MYNNLLLRNLFTEWNIRYACESNRKEVELAGFDALDPSQDSVNNVYEVQRTMNLITLSK